MNLFFHSAMSRKVMLMMLMAPLFSVLCNQVQAAPSKPDTTWSVSFSLNMTKAVNQHIFIPDSDYVYLIMPGIQPLRLVPGPGNIYSAILFDQLDSGATYLYHFRINDTVWENIDRHLTAKPGMVNVSAWWNNEAISTTTFNVNMQFAVQNGIFNPLSDSVCMVGTMNDDQGATKMVRKDTTLIYSFTDTLLVPGSVQQYKYRINLGDTAKGQVELLFRPDRIVRIPDTLLTISNDYNNFNPGKRLITFQCDMSYFVNAHHFDIFRDYLDIAGNFNGMGANDALFDTDGDTVYSVELFLDTAWIHQGPLSFKFRINGNWNSAELTGKPNRTYVFHDTIHQNPNIYRCYFNDLNPSILTPPWVYNVDIQGLLIYKKFLSGIYAYEDVNGIPEGISTYRWLRSTNSQGTDAVAIDSAWQITYVVDTLDIGKWMVFEVTPKAASGDSSMGKPVRVVSSNSISAWDVGMGKISGLITRVYPNPAIENIVIEAKEAIDRIELVNYLGQPVIAYEGIDSKSARITLGQIPHGLYLLKATTKAGNRGVARFVKN